MAVRVCAYGWTGVACMCTVQTTTAVQQAALHRAAPRRPPLILLQPSSNRLLSEASFVPV